MKKKIIIITLGSLILLVGLFTVNYVVHLKEESTIEKFNQNVYGFTKQVNKNLEKNVSTMSMSLESDIKSEEIIVTIEIPKSEQEKQTDEHIESVIKRSAKENGLDSFSFIIEIKTIT